MNRKHNAELTANAKALRKNMTKEERHLWYDFLRSYPVRFLRQKVIDQYIADFYCHDARLVIELDGSQHYRENELRKDKIRTEKMANRNLVVIRIPNNEVNKNFEGFVSILIEWCRMQFVDRIPPPPTAVPLPFGKGGKFQTGRCRRW